MKRIYLLRHALPESGSDTGRDADRPLSLAGRHQADALGLLMRSSDYKPDFAACSKAVRTRETLHGLGLLNTEHAFFDELYLPQLETLEDFITLKIPDTCEALLIVTHFPGVLDFMHAYGQDRLDYPECSLAVFSCNIENWHEFDKRHTVCDDFIDGSTL